MKICRICRICRIEKEEAKFGRGKKYKGKITLTPDCKECKNAKARQDYKKNRVKISEHRKNLYDPEKARKYTQKWQKNNYEKYRKLDREAGKRYREKNKEELRKKWRERAENKPKQEYNSEKAVAATRKWQKANVEKHRAQDKARQAQKKGILIMPKLCEICRREDRLYKHHLDYSKPLEVLWCCRTCHGMLDRRRREEEQKNKEQS